MPSFPTTPVLDTFNRANGAPGSNWSDQALHNYLSLGISSNTLARNASNFESNYWNVSTFTDSEVYCDITTAPTGAGLGIIARIQNPNAGGSDTTLNWCEVLCDATNSYILQFVNGTRTQIGGNLGVAFVAGDSIGMSVIGDQITAYRKPAAGVWGSIATRTTSVTSTGYIGLYNFNNAALAVDNFGGGRYVAVPESRMTAPRGTAGRWGRTR